MATTESRWTFKKELNLPTLITLVVAVSSILAGYTKYREDRVETEYRVTAIEQAQMSAMTTSQKQMDTAQDLVKQVTRLTTILDDLKEEIRNKK